MLQPITYYLITVFHFALFLVIVIYLAYEKYKGGKEKKQKTRTKKQGDVFEILSHAIYEFWESRDADTKSRMEKKMHYAFSCVSPEKVRSIMRDLLKQYPVSFIGEWRGNFAYVFQDMFDQILKTKAEKLDQTYKAEEKFRKTHQDKKENDVYGNNSLSRDQIDKILGEKNKIEKEKEIVENNFRELQNFLSNFGFKVWDSYKTYLLLKPSLEF